MTDLKGREHRLMDLSQVRDARYKGAGISVGAGNWARCTAELCEWITEINTARGGTSPFPYGLYFFEGDVTALQDPPPELRQGPFLEMVPCDRPDPRAVKLAWSESGTSVGFGFAPLAARFAIAAPDGVTLWIDALPVKDREGIEVMALPLGDRIRRRTAEEPAASREEAGEG